MEIQFKRYSEKAIAPLKKTHGSAGYDLFLSVSKVVKYGSHEVIKTELMTAIPNNHDSKVFARSDVPLSKLCHRNPTKVKLVTVISYVRKTEKRHPLSSSGICIFSLEISKFSYIRQYKYRLHFGT